MKNTKQKSPISILLSIVDDGVSKRIEEYLNKNNLNCGVVFSGKGTAESEIADIFGFGMSDKDIVICIIPNSRKEQIIADINDITGVEKDEFGLNMVIKINSASSNLLEMMNIKVVE